MALMIREYFSVESGLVPMMLGRLDAGLYLNFCKPSKLPSLGKHEIRFYRTECTARVFSHQCRAVFSTLGSRLMGCLIID